MLLGFSVAAPVAAEKCETKCDKEASKCETVCSKKKVHFSVKGEGCSKSLTSALAQMEGVSVEKACGASGSVVIATEGEACKKSLKTAVKNSGFQVLGEKVSLPVKGMTCGSCEGKLSKALAKVEGVTVERVCSKSGSATVVLDSEQVTEKQVKAAIKSAGFNKGV